MSDDLERVDVISGRVSGPDADTRSQRKDDPDHWSKAISVDVDLSRDRESIATTNTRLRGGVPWYGNTSGQE